MFSRVSDDCTAAIQSSLTRRAMFIDSWIPALKGPARLIRRAATENSFVAPATEITPSLTVGPLPSAFCILLSAFYYLLSTVYYLPFLVLAFRFLFWLLVVKD